MRTLTRTATLLTLAAGLSAVAPALANSSDVGADSDHGATPNVSGAPAPHAAARHRAAHPHPTHASGRSAAVSGTFCATPTRTCLLGTATLVGRPCACGLTGGATSPGRVTP